MTQPALPLVVAFAVVPLAAPSSGLVELSGALVEEVMPRVQEG